MAASSSSSESGTNLAEIEEERDSSEQQAQIPVRRSLRGGRGVRRTGRFPLRGRTRGRGRGRTTVAKLPALDRDRVKQLCEKRKESMKKLVAEMEEAKVREWLLLEIERQPAMMFDLLQTMERKPDEEKSPSDAPEWCTCRKCRDMPTDEEKLCCGQAPDTCLSQTPEMDMLVLQPGVINITNLLRADIFAVPAGTENRAMRHGAYRQFVLWRHGRLGEGVRRIIPSCCVWCIRDTFPEASHQYTGFMPARLV